MKPLKIAGFIAVLLLSSARAVFAEVVDDATQLVIPEGAIYTLEGLHTYSDFVRIDGTLYVAAYNGSGTSGKLEIAASSITISATGKVIADGRGYLSGSGPGRGKDGETGGGASYGGRGGGETSAVYGSLVEPADLGSGGGYKIDASSYPGGSGGGLIRFSGVDVLTVDGRISANGDPGDTGGAGSGGSILIAASRIVGTGVIMTNGNYGYNYHSGGGGGRIALSAQYNLFRGTISANGGDSSFGFPGGPGSVLVNGVLVYDNGGITGNTDVLGTNYTGAQISKVIVKSGAFARFAPNAVFGGALEISAATVAVNDVLSVGSVTLTNGGSIVPEQHQIDLTVKGEMSISEDGGIIADGRGYPAGSGPGRGKDGVYDGGGGSYGGQGGGSDMPPYGSLINPVDFGSGGGYKIDTSSYPGGAGGGFIRLSVNGNLTVSGVISANGLSGENYVGGAGSGGGINIASGKLSGSGRILANGNYGFSSNGGGGGGRIAVYYGQKTFTGTIAATGGASAWGPAGDSGSIVDNGAIISGGNLAPGESITAPSETIGSKRTLTESATEASLAFYNLVASGTLPGSVNIPQLNIVRINTGAYAGKGFAKGVINASLDGRVYGGAFEGTAFQQGSTLTIKGLATGDISGSVELELTESLPGSGIFNRINGLLNCNRIGDKVLVKVFLSGDGNRVLTQDYPAAKWDLTQTAVHGNMIGDYAGPFNAIFTVITMAEPANPHNGEGFSFASYSTDKGEAPGWTYAKRIESGVITVTGMLDSPLYALIQGVFNSIITPGKFLLNTEKLDNSLLALRITSFYPYGVSPGGTYPFGIRVDNQGKETFENMSVVLVAPAHMAFDSASGAYTLHSSVYWSGEKYDPIPCLRWDFPQIVPGQTINLSYSLKARVGVMTNGEVMKGNVYVMPTQTALGFLPVYDDDGPTDDDVIDEADMQYVGGQEIVIRLLH